MSGSTINSSTNIDASKVLQPIWPITIKGGSALNPTVITITEDLTFSVNNRWFIIDSDYVTIDGGNHTITIDCYIYSGLVRNGKNNENGKNYITVKNINISVINGSLNSGSGWIGQTNFARSASNNLIDNCSTNGDVAVYFGGGIVGSYAAAGGGSNLSITNCYSTGNITNNSFGGGIVGSDAASGGGTLYINNCYFTGSICNGSSYSSKYLAGGGIVGCTTQNNIDNNTNSSVIITNCYSTGSIGNYAGGIYGTRAGGDSFANLSITNCYSTGDIGNYAGGIVGAYAGGESCTITVSQCYSRGKISGSNAGGLYGWFIGGYGSNLGPVRALNCYSSGLITGSNAGGFYEKTRNNLTVYDCYSADGSWLDINANNSLTGKPSGPRTVGNVWMSLAANTPYLLSSISGELICFKQGSLILTDVGYRPIETLKQGDLVKTYRHGYKAIEIISKRNINHVASEERIKDQLYRCSQDNYPDLFEDLIITGCHSILVDGFTAPEQIEKSIEINSGKLCMTDNKYRLPACVDNKTEVYDQAGNHMIYHLALENDNMYKNYGIYANGLLVESCSKRYLKELSNMNTI